MLQKNNLLNIFFIILILLNFNDLLFAQQIKKCKLIEQQVREIAKRHAIAGESMKTEMIIGTFNNNCFSKAQLIEIYEKEYLLIKDVNKGFNWKAFSIVSIILAILLIIFSELVKKIAHSIYQYISSKVYKRFCNSNWVQNIAIQKYKKALYYKYSEIIIPFRPTRPLKMEEVFVPLKAIDNSVKNQMDVITAIANFKKIMIIGSPGSGKSMLCKNILFNYGNNNKYINRIPVLIELHRLNNADSIIKLIENELERNSFINSDYFISYNLKQGNLFLLFDGFDEINSKERKRVSQMLRDFIDLYKNCHFLITSRTAVYNNEFADILEQTFELIEFNYQQITQFLKSWRKWMPEDKSVEHLMLTLQDRPHILRMATNPLSKCKLIKVT